MPPSREGSRGLPWRRQARKQGSRWLGLVPFVNTDSSIALPRTWTFSPHSPRSTNSPRRWSESSLPFKKKAMTWRSGNSIPVFHDSSSAEAQRIRWLPSIWVSIGVQRIRFALQLGRCSRPMTQWATRSRLFFREARPVTIWMWIAYVLQGDTGTGGSSNWVIGPISVLRSLSSSGVWKRLAAFSPSRLRSTRFPRNSCRPWRIVAWHGRENCVPDRSAIRFLRAARTLIPTACRIRGADWLVGTAWSARGLGRICPGVGSSV